MYKKYSTNTTKYFKTYKDMTLHTNQLTYIQKCTKMHKKYTIYKNTRTHEKHTKHTNTT